MIPCILDCKHFFSVIATIVKSGNIPNFESVENHSGKGIIYGVSDTMNQRSNLAFSTGQNHTGSTQKKVDNNFNYIS